MEPSQAHADIQKERSVDMDALKFIRRVTELVLGPNLEVAPHAMLTQERHGAKSEEHGTPAGGPLPRHQDLLKRLMEKAKAERW